MENAVEALEQRNEELRRTDGQSLRIPSSGTSLGTKHRGLPTRVYSAMECTRRTTPHLRGITKMRHRDRTGRR
ncbi:hypothetical protein CR513_59563, partial [Mucuna pruriens]